MKTSKILVGINGATMEMSSGAKVVAIYPAQKGKAESYLLMNDGKFSTLPGARINGVGVIRYFTERQFEVAPPGNEFAETLADMVDAREGRRLIEQQQSVFAKALESRYAGKVCTFVPFDKDKEPTVVTVNTSKSLTSTCIDLQQGFSSGMVSVEYNTEARDCSMGVNLGNGWLIGPDDNPKDMPRHTEFGGPVEMAVFMVINSGLGILIGSQNLEIDENAQSDERFCKGLMQLQLTSEDSKGDLLTVGINAGDELVVNYTRKGNVIYERQGLIGNNALQLGAVIGAIAAVLVRVGEMSAVPVKATRARTQKAA